MPEETQRIPEEFGEREMYSSDTISESQEPKELDLESTDSFAVSFRGMVAPEALDRVMEDEERLRYASDGDGDEDFDFAFVPRDSFRGFEPLDAEKLFSDGQILPVYPSLIRGHAAEESQNRILNSRGGADLTRTSSSESSDSGDLDGVPAEIYCIWDPRTVLPSPRLRKKSRSTGTCSMRSRLLDFIARRSHSDGKEKFIFLTASQSTDLEKYSTKSTGDGSSKTIVAKKRESPAAAAPKEPKKNSKPVARARSSEIGLATAHRVFYVDRVAVSGRRRQSFLPYRQDLLGIFANPHGSPARSLYTL